MPHTAGVFSVEHSIVACCEEFWAEHNDRVRADGYLAGQEHALEWAGRRPWWSLDAMRTDMRQALARLRVGEPLEEESDA
jgi:hypothetical protein